MYLFINIILITLKSILKNHLTLYEYFITNKIIPITSIKNMSSS